MSIDDQYKDMKPLALSAVGYLQDFDDEEPSEYEVSVWVNDLWETNRPVLISIEGYSGTTQFGFELTKEQCLALSDIIWSELFKRGITREIDL